MDTTTMKFITLVACLAFQLSVTTDLFAQANADSVPALNAKEQSIVTISAFTAQGDLEQLKKALSSGLEPT